MSKDYSNVNMSLNNIVTYLKENGIELNSEESKKLNTIFKECDTENLQGEKKPDGELSGNERSAFYEKIGSVLPRAWQKLIDFSIIMDVRDQWLEKEKIKQMQQECKAALNDPSVKEYEQYELERVEKEMQGENTKNDINFGLD